ncbi:porin family protein [Hymenobacter sp. UYCo722]|uniref:porin family protein n=1 Tax=Hymenobacter sp. UYCo722 TaxID=3156335 RepID=UPI0033914858
MKNIFLLSALALATGLEARAQGGLTSKDYDNGATGTESRNTGFGIKGGYNVSNLRGSNVALFPNANSLAAFNAGAYGQFGFTNFASLQVELLYSRKGYHTDASATTGPGAYQAFDTRLDYVQLPILFVGNFTETLSFHFGPQVGILTKVLQGDQNLDLKANGYNSLDYGAVGGVEARLGLGRLGVRYELGLGNIYQEGTVVRYQGAPVTLSGAGTDGNIHNQTFQVYLGIGFRK